MKKKKKQNPPTPLPPKTFSVYSAENVTQYAE